VFDFSNIFPNIASLLETNINHLNFFDARDVHRYIQTPSYKTEAMRFVTLCKLGAEEERGAWGRLDADSRSKPGGKL
jgi:hypothetical protein